MLLQGTTIKNNDRDLHVRKKDEKSKGLEQNLFLANGYCTTKNRQA